MELIARQQATNRTIAAYIDRKKVWGESDCARMAAVHIKNMGHQFSLSKVGTYSTPAGALRAIKRMGFESLFGIADSMFDRITPAKALVGDIIALPSDDPLGALAIKLSNNRIMNAWEDGFVIATPHLFEAAWRVPCLIEPDLTTNIE